MGASNFSRGIAWAAIFLGVLRFLDYFGYINYCVLCRANPAYGLGMAIQALGGGLLVLFLLRRWFPKDDLRMRDN